jgi:hypothetical protein
VRSRDEVLDETQDGPAVPLRRRTRAATAPSTAARTRPGPLIATAAIALAIGAAGGWYTGHRGAGTTAQAASTGTVTTDARAASDAASGQKPVRVGQGIALHGPGGENITAVLVGITDPATGNVSHPDPGNRYVSARIRLENHGTTTWNGHGAPTIGAHVVDVAGQSYGPIIASTNAGPMYTAQVIIAPGQSEVGVITFSVPENAAVHDLQIVLDDGSGPVAQWRIS